jgi:hypothetical protein
MFTVGKRASEGLRGLETTIERLPKWANVRAIRAWYGREMAPKSALDLAISLKLTKRQWFHPPNLDNRAVFVTIFT